MDKKIHILCAMRDCRVINEIIRCMEDEERCTFQVVGNGDAVMLRVSRFVPDILVIDSVLPNIDGLGVLDQLNATLGDRRPRVIGGSMMPFSDAGFIRRGVTRLVRVPWEKEQLETAILDTIREIEEGVDWPRIQAGYRCAVNLLTQLGMKHVLRGFDYLAWAAALAWDNDARLYAIGDLLYTPIANRFGTQEQSVERLIRHAVESAVDSIGAPAIYVFFGNTLDPMRGKPTNAQMIGMLVQRMRMQEKET